MRRTHNPSINRASWQIWLFWLIWLHGAIGPIGAHLGLDLGLDIWLNIWLDLGRLDIWLDVCFIALIIFICIYSTCGTLFLGIDFLGGVLGDFLLKLPLKVLLILTELYEINNVITIWFSQHLVWSHIGIWHNSQPLWLQEARCLRALSNKFAESSVCEKSSFRHNSEREPPKDVPWSCVG